MIQPVTLPSWVLGRQKRTRYRQSLPSHLVELRTQCERKAVNNQQIKTVPSNAKRLEGKHVGWQG